MCFYINEWTFYVTGNTGNSWTWFYVLTGESGVWNTLLCIQILVPYRKPYSLVVCNFILLIHGTIYTWNILYSGHTFCFFLPLKYLFLAKQSQSLHLLFHLVTTTSSIQVCSRPSGREHIISLLVSTATPLINLLISYSVCLEISYCLVKLKLIITSSWCDL